MLKDLWKKPIDWDAETREILDQHGFATLPFEKLVTHLQQHGVSKDENRLTSKVEVLSLSSLTNMTNNNGDQRKRLRQVGQKAIDAGEVGVVVLNGGMATRFGGKAKGATTAIEGRSFLDLKLSQVAVASNGKVPIFLMNSFTTQKATEEHLTGLDIQCPVSTFTQMVSIRVTPEGEPFLGEDGKPSLYAPGHGDFPFALQESGQLESFIKGGGKILTLSNVDNLGASLDPMIIGAHIEGQKPMSVEVVKTNPGDVGGFPAIVEGNSTIVEAFRIPVGFDTKTIPAFNTNTFVFDAEILQQIVELDWFAVKKEVEGRPVIQFERLVGQLADHFEVTWLLVPRTGKESRFIPIKVPKDLEESADLLHEALKEQGVL